MTIGRTNPEKRRTDFARIRLWPAAILCALILRLAGVSALADGPHTVTLSCGAGGYAGLTGRNVSEVTLTLPETFPGADGETMTPAELAGLPDFRLLGASLRLSVSEVQGAGLLYSLVCGRSFSVPGQAPEGRNLWDVTIPASAWLTDPEKPLRIVPMHSLSDNGILVREGSVSLQLRFTTSAKLRDFPEDRVREDPMLDAALSMLEAGNPFIAAYDDMADSLLSASLPLGVPYYYAGATEAKFLKRFYPQTITRYYRPDRMYLCGLDCVGMTHLVFEKCGLERHPSISDLLYRGAGSTALRRGESGVWPAMLRQGELIAVKHGTFHIMMYLGTLRQFGWNENSAGEAAPLLDEPLVIHCGGNPFYYDRYAEYIREQGYRDTYPPDGGVTVSVIRQTNKDAPHSRNTSWGKHFGWYLLGDYPLLVFPLDDCTETAWYAARQP